MRITTRNRQRPKSCWTKVLGLLFLLSLAGASVRAHDPGSSAAHVRLERDQIVVLLNFARAEVAGLLARDAPEKVAAEAFEVAFDGLPMPASEVHVRPGEGGDIQFVLTFPREPALLLTLRSALIVKLNPNHRQMFSLTDDQNRLLASRTLEPQKNSFDFDLAAPPPSTLRQWMTLLIGLALAFGLGAGHALEPGHGKTLVAAYLIGSRGTAAHAVVLGATVTLTHTFGVFLLGLGTLVAARHMDVERLNPWIAFGSGLVIVGIGLSLLIRRWKGASHGHHHRHPHDHHDHSHDHSHDHGHHHEHGHEGAHPHGSDHSHPHSHAHGHGHDPAHDHTHSVSEHVHPHHEDEEAGAAHLRAHLPAGQVTWRQLLGLGISGGIVPCPGALTTLLGFIAIGRPGYGLLSVVAFSLGLASVLTGIGLLLVQGGRWVQQWRGDGRWMQWLPAVSALVITVIGVVISVQALAILGR